MTVDLVGRQLARDVMVGGRVYAKRGEAATGRLLDTLSAVPSRHIDVRPYVSAEADDLVYINAFEESDAIVAQCSAELDRLGQFGEESVSARRGDELLNVAPEDVDYIDLTPRQVVSASTALIPFLEHDDANRALMGCNMQRQAVPLLHPQTALVATGMEVDVARDSGHQVTALSDGTVTSVTSGRIDVTPDGGGEVAAPRAAERGALQRLHLDRTDAGRGEIPAGEGRTADSGRSGVEGWRACPGAARAGGVYELGRLQLRRRDHPI